MNQKLFKILTIDGGGIRGIYPAHILACIKERLNIDITGKFDLIAGTSTGSIIAAGIATKIDPLKIVELYKEEGKHIFKKKGLLPDNLKAALYSRYKSNHLSKILTNIFGNRTLGEVEKPLILPATNIGNGRVHIFKSSYHEEFKRDNNVLITDAILSSCAAPTFFNPHKTKEYLLSDGGLWANNPTLVAYIDAIYRLKIEPKNIRIFSIGTGNSKTAYGTNTNKKWGLVSGWKGTAEFINFLMSLQAQSIENQINLLLDPKQIMRINYTSDKQLPLDDYTKTGDILSQADMDFTYKSAAIERFLQEEL
jgi:patatin-like phospholipase/acyl hydrolase